MHGYDIRLSDEPGDVMHVDMDGPATDEELAALREFFIAVRAEREAATSGENPEVPHSGRDAAGRGGGS